MTGSVRTSTDRRVRRRRSPDEPSAATARPLGVALLGCGVVGTRGGPAAPSRRPTTWPRGSARRWSCEAIAVRRAGRDRGLGSTPTCSPTTPTTLVRRDDVDLVIELIGGIEPARSLLLAAMAHGASVVTANKALLAEDGASCTPRPRRPSSTSTSRRRSPARSRSCARWRESLAGDRVRRVIGHRQRHHQLHPDPMDEPGAGFATRWRRRSELGYAEADPTADIEGSDAAAKAAILASLAFHTRVTVDDVYREGIAEVTADDVASPPRWATWSSRWPSASGTTPRRPRRSARGAPRDDPAHATRSPASARRTTRSSSRPRRPAS